MSNATSGLYRIARAARWAEVLSKALSGHPAPLARRLQNRVVMTKFVGPLLRK
jgi:hypothetical protein